MTIPVTDLAKVRILPPRQYKFEPKLLEGKDAKGNLGLNAILRYQYLEGNKWLKRDIRIEVEPGLDTDGRIPYAYQFVPPLERKLSKPRVPSTRTFPIIRIVAAPGVNIYQPKFNKKKPSQKDPFVEIIRVQDPGLVPPLGRDIYIHNFINTTTIDPDPTSNLLVLKKHDVRIELKRDGVDFVQDMFRTRFIVRVKQDGTNSGIDRFLYKFVKRSGRTVLVIMATKTVKVEIRETGILPLQLPQSFFNGHDSEIDDRKLRIEYLPVPNLFVMNVLAIYFYLEDFPWMQKGHIVESSAGIPIKHVPDTDSIIGLAIIDATIGFIPVVGDLYDLAQFVHGVATGKDIHGITVSDAELAVMGLCVLFPFVSFGLAKSLGKGAKAVKELGSKADSVEELAGGMRLDDKGRDLLEEASNRIAQGKRLPPKLIDEIMSTVQLPGHKILSMDDLLDASKSNFTYPKILQEKYLEYIAEQTRKGNKISPPDKWARNQRQGTANDVLLWLLGKDFRKIRKPPTQGKFTTINAADVIRPALLDDPRLTKFIESFLEDSQFQLLMRKIPVEKIVNGKISKEFFDILKGNIGEILAKEYKDTLLAAKKSLHGDNIELYESVTIVIKKKDGNFTNEFWEFTDGIIGGLNKEGDFVISDIIEIKAGDAVANKVQKQVFDWVEDKITDGARIRLPDGREFDYFPTDPSSKRVIGLANAKRHVINPQGKSHLGMDSSQQIAAKLDRTELPANSEEIKFIAALIQNTHEVPLKTTNAELDYLVAELAQRISATGSNAP